MANILIIDDDKLVCETIANAVVRAGHHASSALSLQDGLDRVRAELFDVVYLDVRLPDGNGLDILPSIRETPSNPEVIIITGYGDPDGAELAIRNGAWDYIEKPCFVQTITLPLVRALQYREERTKQKPVHLNREGIIGCSPALNACLDLVAQAAGSDANVLLSGETGTGKELFAFGIHKNSRRAEKSFVVVDCPALPKTLVESILFGHEKGAYTGADRAREGLILQADGGTLFLDEVAELPPPVQNSFLRVLQERRFRPIGRQQEVQSNFRLIAASNRNLDAMVRQGDFREDLLFRLRSLTIDLPPLRERREDIKELTRYYVVKLSENYNIQEKKISPEVFDVLMQYNWPGNIRELINTLEKAIAAAPNEPILFQKHLPTRIRVDVARASLGGDTTHQDSGERSPSPAAVLPRLQKFRETAVTEAEKRYLTDLLSVTEGDIQKACQISGLSRSRLYALLKKHRIYPSG